MSNPIGWCDTTWNPIVGCSKCSPGCDHCYTETMAVRLAAMGQEKYQAVTTVSQEVFEKTNKKYPGWNGKCYVEESELEKPFHWKSSRRIFISSMGDLFYENIPFKWIDKVMAVVCENPRHKFMILTKRPERMKEYFDQQTLMIDRPNTSKLFFFHALENLYLGVTAENQEMADLRIPILLDTPAAMRFVSIEPMLGPVNIKNYIPSLKSRHVPFGPHGRIDSRKQSICPTSHKVEFGEWCGCGLNWVILGGENGHGARPMDLEWARKVRDDCKAAGVPFFFKGWGAWKPETELTHEWNKNAIEYSLENKEIGTIVPWRTVLACDKRNYGSLAYQCKTEKGAIVLVKSREKNDYLDGVQYHEFPEVKK